MNCWVPASAQDAVTLHHISGRASVAQLPLQSQVLLTGVSRIVPSRHVLRRTKEEEVSALIWWEQSVCRANSTATIATAEVKYNFCGGWTSCDLARYVIIDTFLATVNIAWDGTNNRAKGFDSILLQSAVMYYDIMNYVALSFGVIGF